MTDTITLRYGDVVIATYDVTEVPLYIRFQSPLYVREPQNQDGVVFGTDLKVETERPHKVAFRYYCNNSGMKLLDGITVV